MKIATFNVNGVNGRLPVLLRWLTEAEPDVACLQELKAAQEKSPESAIRAAGYGVIWHGQKAGTESPFSRAEQNPLRPGAGCRGTLMTCTAATSRRR